MKEFQTDTFILRIYANNMKELIVKRNKTLQASDVNESIKISSEYKPSTKFYVLLEGEENASVSIEARRAAASQAYAQCNAALALCSNSTVNAIMGNLFLKISKPIIPTRFFKERNDAVNWLNQHIEKSK